MRAVGQTEAARLKSATINVALTCCLIYVAGWTSGAGLLPRWLAAPAAAVLVVMEVSQARSLLRGLLRCKAKSEEGLRLIAEAEDAQREAQP